MGVVSGFSPDICHGRRWPTMHMSAPRCLPIPGTAQTFSRYRVRPPKLPQGQCSQHHIARFRLRHTSSSFLRRKDLLRNLCRQLQLLLGRQQP